MKSSIVHRKSSILLFCFLCSCILWFLTLSGCSGHAESFGAGLTTGAVVTHTLEGIQKELDEKQAALIAERQTILDQLSNANDDAEKLALQAQVDSLTKQLQAAAQTSTVVQLGQAAITTDWKDSQQVAPWVSSAVLAIIGFWAGRKKKASE